MAAPLVHAYAERNARVTEFWALMNVLLHETCALQRCVCAFEHDEQLAADLVHDLAAVGRCEKAQVVGQALQDNNGCGVTVMARDLVDAAECREHDGQTRTAVL